MSDENQWAAESVGEFDFDFGQDQSNLFQNSLSPGLEFLSLTSDQDLFQQQQQQQQQLPQISMPDSAPIFHFTSQEQQEQQPQQLSQFSMPNSAPIFNFTSQEQQPQQTAQLGSLSATRAKKRKIQAKNAATMESQSTSSTNKRTAEEKRRVELEQIREQMETLNMELFETIFELMEEMSKQNLLSDEAKRQWEREIKTTDEVFSDDKSTVMTNMQTLQYGQNVNELMKAIKKSIEKNSKRISLVEKQKAVLSQMEKASKKKRRTQEPEQVLQQQQQQQQSNLALPLSVGHSATFVPQMGEQSQRTGGKTIFAPQMGEQSQRTGGKTIFAPQIGEHSQRTGGKTIFPNRSAAATYLSQTSTSTKMSGKKEQPVLMADFPTEFRMYLTQEEEENQYRKEYSTTFQIKMAITKNVLSKVYNVNFSDLQDETKHKIEQYILKWTRNVNDPIRVMYTSILKS